jgi:iron complex transport system substrate-binding protein
VRRGTLLVALLSAAAVASASPPRRIVSLAPNLTELAYAAGAGGALVGTVEYSDYPEAAKSLPRVGDAWRVDLERVVALHPDLVLVWPSGTPQSVTDRLQQLGLHTIAVPTYRLADVPAALRRIGALAGSGAEAERAAADFERAVSAQRAAHAQAAPVSVFIQIDDEPVFTVNGRHVISEVVELCGGRNVFAELPQLAPPVATEAVLARDPEVIVSADEAAADPKAQWSRWERLKAVRAGTIYQLPADLVSRATPRLAQGVDATCAALDDARRRLRR